MFKKDKKSNAPNNKKTRIRELFRHGPFLPIPAIDLTFYIPGYSLSTLQLTLEMSYDILRHLWIHCYRVGVFMVGVGLFDGYCCQGLKIKYYRVNRLLTDLAIGRRDGSYNRIMQSLVKSDLFVLNDWGMAVLASQCKGFA